MLLIIIIIIIANKLQGVYCYRILITENIKRINIIDYVQIARVKQPKCTIQNRG